MFVPVTTKDSVSLPALLEKGHRLDALYPASEDIASLLPLYIYVSIGFSFPFVVCLEGIGLAE